MKYYIIAGEASGDLHASNLIAEIKKKDNKAEFRAWGGDLMRKQGVTMVKHYRHMAFMGFVEVALNLRKILGNIKECKTDLLKYKPGLQPAHCQVCSPASSQSVLLHFTSGVGLETASCQENQTVRR